MSGFAGTVLIQPINGILPLFLCKQSTCRNEEVDAPLEVEFLAKHAQHQVGGCWWYSGGVVSLVYATRVRISPVHLSD